MDVFVSVLLLQSRHHPFLVIFVKFVFHLLSCHSGRSRRIHCDGVALFSVKLDPVHKVHVAQSSSLWGLQASRLRDFHSQDGCATKNSSFITTPPAPARRSS